MKSSYKPPFTISDKTINLIAEISAQIEPIRYPNGTGKWLAIT